MKPTRNDQFCQWTIQPSTEKFGALLLHDVEGFEQSGGHARIYSEGGHGTTVKLYLPRYLGAVPQEEPKRGESAPLGTAHETVLLVEDEARVRQLAADGLQELGYTVLLADGTDAALKILDSDQDIVLLFTDVSCRT